MLRHFIQAQSYMKMHYMAWHIVSNICLSEMGIQSRKGLAFNNNFKKTFGKKEDNLNRSESSRNFKPQLFMAFKCKPSQESKSCFSENSNLASKCKPRQVGKLSCAEEDRNISSQEQFQTSCEREAKLHFSRKKIQTSCER